MKQDRVTDCQVTSLQQDRFVGEKLADFAVY